MDTRELRQPPGLNCTRIDSLCCIRSSIRSRCMKITGLTAHLFEPKREVGQDVAQWQYAKTHQNGVAVIHTDEGIDGVVAMRASDIKDIVNYWPAAREVIEGQDVLDRARIDELLRRRFYWPLRARGILDYGLWDI